MEIDGAPHTVEDLQIQTPSARGGASFYKLRFRNLATKQKLDRQFKGEDQLGDVDFARREVQFLYEQGGAYEFMDLTDYSQFTLNATDIEQEIPYLIDDIEGIRALVADGRILGIELPPSVEMRIVECEPAMKGATAQARAKPATMPTGLVVNVPEYLAPGDGIRIDTRTGKFLGRA